MKYIKQKLLFTKNPQGPSGPNVKSCPPLKTEMFNLNEFVSIKQNTRPADKPQNFSERSIMSTKHFPSWKINKVHQKEICIILKNTGHTCHVQNHSMRGWAKKKKKLGLTQHEPIAAKGGHNQESSMFFTKCGSNSRLISYKLLTI